MRKVKVLTKVQPACEPAMASQPAGLVRDDGMFLHRYKNLCKNDERSVDGGKMRNPR